MAASGVDIWVVKVGDVHVRSYSGPSVDDNEISKYLSMLDAGIQAPVDLWTARSELVQDFLVLIGP